MKSEQLNELAAALCKAQAALRPAAMNATNPFLKNKYADLGAVIEAARKPMADNGLSISQLVGGDDAVISITTILLHNSGQWLESTVSMTMGEERGKSAAQVAGSIITYLRRYSFASVLGIYADEDTDGSESKQDKPSKEQHAAKPAQPIPQAEPEPHAKPERPYPATIVKKGLEQKAKTYEGKNASPKQRSLMVMLIDQVLQDDTKRHNVCKFLFGTGSSKAMADAQVLAAIDWLDPQQDNGGAYSPSDIAAREVNNVYQAAIAEGQPALV